VWGSKRGGMVIISRRAGDGCTVAAGPCGVLWRC
jgi:hypothetical protein